MRWFPDFASSSARSSRPQQSRPRKVRGKLLGSALVVAGVGAWWLVAAQDDPAAAPAGDDASSVEATESRDAGDAGRDDRVVSAAFDAVASDEVFFESQRLWERHVPAAIRERYAFPTIDEVRELLGHIEAAFAEGSPEKLATYERDARRALRLLRRLDGGDVFASWLEPRLDLVRAAAQIEAAQEALDLAKREDPSEVEKAQPGPLVPGVGTHRPQYSRAYWDRVMARRAPPRRAAEYVPRLKEIFSSAGVPPELVWIAEVESAMNPEALSPVGARGMFQFMPLTAARFGLQAGVLVDERTDPEKSARAAAAYLRVLHRRFQSWPLALAAYNAGEGRVGRALAAEKVGTFEEVAHRLPIETRMYVPKVLATVAVRESIDPDVLPGPRPLEPVRSQVVRDGAGESGEPTGAPPASVPGTL